ncbi:MAG: VanZ family protein [Longimicrobiales bacterium]
MEERSEARGPAGSGGAAAQPSRASVRLRGLRQAARLLLAAWLVVLVGLTLVPVPSSGDPDEPMSRTCLICGDRGTADALLNLAFFVPLGLALAHRRRGVVEALLLGTLLSASVELAQTFVPGRYPTFGDVLWNGLGAAVGALGVRGVARHLAHPSVWAGLAAATLVGGSVALGGWLIGPSATDAPYFGQWTADLGHMPEYEGTLLSASLDGTPIPNTRFADAVHARDRLVGPWVIEARVVKGTPPPAVSPILSVYDLYEAEILVLGAHGEDLVLRERTRAKALLLDHPDLRLPGALGRFDVGDTLTIGARSLGHERCLSVAGTETCGLGFTPGRTWSLLLYLEGPSERTRTVIDALWLMTLLFAAGTAATSARSLLANGSVVVALVGASVLLTRLVAPPPWEIAAALAGLLLGWAAARTARRTLIDP